LKQVYERAVDGERYLKDFRMQRVAEKQEGDKEIRQLYLTLNDQEWRRAVAQIS
jgi:hypothetical protein